MLGKFEALLVILVVALVLFGDKRVPELVRSISRNLRGAGNGFKDDNPSDKSV